MLRRSFALLAVCALSLAACGGDDSADDDPPPTNPPSTEPPVTDPPTTDPPATDPPATDPPPTDPPVTDPPATDPPATTDPPTTDPPDGTDTCLVGGVWELQSQRFFDELIAQSPEAFPGTVTHVGGRQFVEFSPDGSARGGRDQWSFAIAGPQGTTFITIDAIEEGPYSVDGDRFTAEQSVVGEVDVTFEIEQGGVRVPMPIPGGGSFPGEEGAAASGTYTCDGDVFTLTVTEDGITLTNVWDRVTS